MFTVQYLTATSNMCIANSSSAANLFLISYVGTTDDAFTVRLSIQEVPSSCSSLHPKIHDL